MAQRLRIDIEAPACGWTVVRMTAPGVALEFIASHTPRDSISDLAHAAAQLVAGLPEQVVTWNTEPAEYEFRFTTSAGRTRLKVYIFPDVRHLGHGAGPPTAVVEGEAPAVARAIWRALRRLQGSMPADEFAAKWGHPFPTATMGRISERLRDDTADER